ncbi:MAG: hypothetical protein VX265_18425 [Myxococcota bacterium]|nr:hypothetical protein [Myxococcota bacterium]MEC8422465.1 hypothetical protein [Myxococcota bacterium]
MHTATLGLPFLLLVACGAKADGDGPTDTGTPETGAEPTWENVRDDVLVNSCGFGSCHAPPGAAQFGIDETTPAEDLVAVPSSQDETIFIVQPGDPDSSYLVMKLEGEAGIDGEPMPPPAGGLDPAKVQLVRDWISSLP